MDRLYSSLATGYLVEHEITMVQTRMRNKILIPKEVKEVTHCHKNSAEMHWEKDESKPEAYSELC